MGKLQKCVSWFAALQLPIILFISLSYTFYEENYTKLHVFENVSEFSFLHREYCMKTSSHDVGGVSF